jgi:hypothetical protein
VSTRLAGPTRSGRDLGRGDHPPLGLTKLDHVGCLPVGAATAPAVTPAPGWGRRSPVQDGPGGLCGPFLPYSGRTSGRQMSTSQQKKA